MPLAAVALVAYIAGLLTGFAGLAGFGLAAGAVGTIAAAVLRRPVAIAMCTLAASGAIVATAAARSDRDCTLAASHEKTLTLEVDEALAPGAYARASFMDCRAAAWLAVERGSAPAGSIVRVAGSVSLSARGVLVQHADVRVERRAGALVHWRLTAGAAIDSVFRADAPLARALLIADMQGLSPELRDRFAVAGLAHILSISGVHVGLIAVALDLLFTMLGASRRGAALVSLAVIAVYVAMIGLPAPAVRAAGMLSVALLTRLAQRPVSPWSVLALGGAEPVFAPWVAADLGYQLSMIGVVALLAGSALVDRLALHRLPRWARSVAAAVIGTTIATLASAPLVAWVFGRVSLIAPVSNLVASPLIALAQPMLFCGMVLAPLGSAARFIADACHPLLAGLDRVAMWSAAVPHAAVSVSPTRVDAVLAAVASASVLVACASRDRPRAALVAITAFAALVWRPLAPQAAGFVELHMIDVGQGDAIALRMPHGQWVLFDAGRGWEGGDAGRSTILPYLRQRGGGLAAFVLSHPHTDHAGGAATVIRALHPGRYVDAGFPGAAGAYRASLTAARETGTLWTRAHPGDSLVMDGVTLTFLAPDSAWTAHLADPNLASVVTLVRVGDVRFLLTGDAEAAEEDWLVAHQAGALRADVLKVAHHGSSTSSTPSFLAAVRPRLALVSVGAGNTYGHPSLSTLAAIAASGPGEQGLAQVLRTDRLGTIVVRTDGQRVFVDAGGDSWELPRFNER